MEQIDMSSHQQALYFEQTSASSEIPQASFLLRLDKIKKQGRYGLVLRELQKGLGDRLKYNLQIRNNKEGNTLYSMAIPTNPTYYANANFVIGDRPTLLERRTILEQPSLGYKTREFQPQIPANYIQFEEGQNKIAEVGFASEEAQRYFMYHLYGRPFSVEDSQRAIKVNEAVFSHLRGTTDSKDYLQEFALKRGWTNELSDTAQLAYWDPLKVPLEEIASKTGLSMNDMHIAGWCDIVFDQEGNLSYMTPKIPSVLIPYFTEDGNIGYWRKRRVGEKVGTGIRYTAPFLDKSFDKKSNADDVYNGWKLHDVKDKKVIVTEGEFKALVTTEMTGTVTIGLPGIGTTKSERLLQQLVNAQASEYIILFDTDPQSKSSRPDKVTDSDVAAYDFALRLQENGMSVKIGRVPLLPGHDKMGVDDYLLEQGSSAFEELIQKAMQPQNFAKFVGIDETHFQILRVKQELSKAIKNCQNSRRRGLNIVDIRAYTSALNMQAEVESLYNEYMQKSQQLPLN